MRRLLPLLPWLLGSCSLSAGEGPPEPVRIASFEVAPAAVPPGGSVSLAFTATGPVDRLVLAIGGCACELQADDTSFEDTCGAQRACACPCAGESAGEVLYTITALGPSEDRTADTATRAVRVGGP